LRYRQNWEVILVMGMPFRILFTLSTFKMFLSLQSTMPLTVQNNGLLEFRPSVEK